MDNVFHFRDQLIERYGSFSRSFVRIAAPDTPAEVEHKYAQGRYWPEPLVQIQPELPTPGHGQKLVVQGILHVACAEIFSRSGSRTFRWALPEGQERLEVSDSEPAIGKMSLNCAHTIAAR